MAWAGRPVEVRARLPQAGPTIYTGLIELLDSPLALSS